MNIYIVFEDGENNIKYFYIIEQGIDHSKMIIKNIYTTTMVDTANALERFFRYDEEFELDNIKRRLFNIINDIEVITDKEYLQAKITEYLDKSDKQKPLVDTYIDTKKYTYKGVEYNNLSQVAKVADVNYHKLWERVKYGITIDKAVEAIKSSSNKSKSKSKKGNYKVKHYEYAGVETTLKELSELSGINENTLWNRINRANMTVEQAIETPVKK